jgi:hypothetical protein
MRTIATMPEETLFDYAEKLAKWLRVHEVARLATDRSVISPTGNTPQIHRPTSDEMQLTPMDNGRILEIEFHLVSFQPRIRQLHGGRFVA